MIKGKETYYKNSYLHFKSNDNLVSGRVQFKDVVISGILLGHSTWSDDVQIDFLNGVESGKLQIKIDEKPIDITESSKSNLITTTSKGFFNDGTLNEIVHTYDQDDILIKEFNLRFIRLPMMFEVFNYQNYFYPNGNIRIQYLEKWDEFSHNEQYKHYYLDGGLSHIENHINNKADGRQVEYYSNGNLKSETEYKKDKKFGLHREYYENGVKKLEGFYSNDCRDGKWKWYDEKTLIQKEGYYRTESSINSYSHKQDCKYGTWHYYDGNRIIKIEEYDKYGQEHGLFKIYEQGQVIELIYKEGKLLGENNFLNRRLFNL